MNSSLNKFFFLVFFSCCLYKFTNAQNQNKPQVSLVYGTKYIFSIETPANWTIERDMKQEIGFVSIYRPNTETRENINNSFYAGGLDKKTAGENINDIILQDFKKLTIENPNLAYDTTQVNVNDDFRKAIIYSFYGFSDKHREEILYSETDDAFIIIKFSAKSEEDFAKYKPDFNKFINSFRYKGNDPNQFIEFMKNKQKN